MPMSSRGMVWSGSVLAVLAIAAVAGAYLIYPDFFPPPTVTTAVAIRAPVSEAIYGTGTVEPERWAKVVPVQRRRLVELCRCEGQAVKAGQVLGRQDDAEERSALNQLEINNEQLERDLNRALRDRDKSEATKTEYEQRSTQFEESKSRINAQKVRLDALVLRAPRDGMVLRRDGEVGEIVGPTDVLFWVGPPLPMQVVAEVNEEEINRIAVGQKAFLRSEAFPGQALRASVSQITPKGDPTRKTFRVYLLLPNDTPLRIGMSVEANIIFREKPSAIVVPAEAVAGDLGSHRFRRQRREAQCFEIRSLIGRKRNGLQPPRQHRLDPCHDPRAANAGRHGRRCHGRRLHHHDGGFDGGLADRLPAPARRRHAACNHAVRSPHGGAAGGRPRIRRGADVGRGERQQPPRHQIPGIGDGLGAIVAS